MGIVRDAVERNTGQTGLVLHTACIACVRKTWQEEEEVPGQPQGPQGAGNIT